MYTRPRIQMMASSQEYLVGWKVLAACFYMHVRHMSADQVRKEFLQGWLGSRKNKLRGGKKGQKYVY